VALAAVVRSAIGSAAMIRAGSVGLLRPRWDPARLYPILGLGLRFQAANAITLARDQLVNIGVVAISGLATLGLWSLAYRILQVPFTLLSSMVRIGFAAMARLLGAGHDPRPTLERGLWVVSVAAAALVVPVASSAPAVVVPLFGERWAEVPSILVWASIGLMIGTPISVIANGYLLVSGESRLVLTCAVAKAVVWLGVGLGLLPLLGPVALGLGWIASGAVNVTLYATRVTRMTGASLTAPLLIPLAAAIAGGTAGWLVASAGPPSIPLGVLAAVVGLAVTIGGIGLVRAAALKDTARLIGASLRGTRARRGAPVGEPAGAR
jgi:O-antigen/teichoic acid export membrane protein